MGCLIMLELVISVCLLSDPTRCKDVSLTYFNDGASPMQCMMKSQIEISKWAEGHPKWFAKKWSCRRAGQIAKI